ncbi:MAG: CzcE family metal-binding protein [Burkholderiaceae bacterium]|nr:CzcE family metal-binding protein [Burkholderiaceae bacterium]
MNKKSAFSLAGTLATGFTVLTLLGTSISASAAPIADPYGVPAAGSLVDRVIRIDSATRSIQVARFERVRFEFADGTPSVQWYFDTLGHPVFDLKQIIPAQAANQKVKVYVAFSVEEIGS